MGHFRILAAVPGFFLSSYFLMLLMGVIAARIGLVALAVSYIDSMLINITLWLAVAPLAASGVKSKNQEPLQTPGRYAN